LITIKAKGLKGQEAMKGKAAKQTVMVEEPQDIKENLKLKYARFT